MLLSKYDLFFSTSWRIIWTRCRRSCSGYRKNEMNRGWNTTTLTPWDLICLTFAGAMGVDCLRLAGCIDVGFGNAASTMQSRTNFTGFSSSSSSSSSESISSDSDSSLKNSFKASAAWSAMHSSLQNWAYQQLSRRDKSMGVTRTNIKIIANRILAASSLAFFLLELWLLSECSVGESKGISRTPFRRAYSPRIRMSRNSKAINVSNRKRINALSLHWEYKIIKWARSAKHDITYWRRRGSNTPCSPGPVAARSSLRCWHMQGEASPHNPRTGS